MAVQILVFAPSDCWKVIKHRRTPGICPAEKIFFRHNLRSARHPRQNVLQKIFLPHKMPGDKMHKSRAQKNSNVKNLHSN